jgi:hypothetical protein
MIGAVPVLPFLETPGHVLKPVLDDVVHVQFVVDSLDEREQIALAVQGLL